MKSNRARTTRSFVTVVILALAACNSMPDDRGPQRSDTAAVAIPQPAQARIQPATGQQYFVFGEVQQEGAQDFLGDVTVFEAVTKAQPRKDSANLGRVRLIRADPRDPYALTIDIQHLIETGDSTHNTLIRPGDIIEVPAAEPKR
jgi:protein involved in polysaccharide export with SLBB domain